jgi:hypothetical protein
MNHESRIKSQRAALALWNLCRLDDVSLHVNSPLFNYNTRRLSTAADMLKYAESLSEKQEIIITKAIKLIVVQFKT